MDFSPEIFLAIGGAALGYITRILTSDEKRASALARIQGQLDQVVGHISGIEDVKVRQAVIEGHIDQLEKDVNEAYRRIRELETPIL